MRLLQFLICCAMVIYRIRRSNQCTLAKIAFGIQHVYEQIG